MNQSHANFRNIVKLLNRVQETLKMIPEAGSIRHEIETLNREKFLICMKKV